MLKTLIASLVLVLLVSQSARAQSVGVDKLTPALPTAGERHGAEVASNVTVAAVVALDVWQARHSGRALVLTGVRYGVTQGASFALKKLIGRVRPCASGPDVHGYNRASVCGADDPDYSFPSGHTATAFAATGGARLAFTLPLSISTGGLRIAAGKHWLTDTLAGAGVGLLTSRIR